MVLPMVTGICVTGTTGSSTGSQVLTRDNLRPGLVIRVHPSALRSSGHTCGVAKKTPVSGRQSNRPPSKSNRREAVLAELRREQLRERRIRIQGVSVVVGAIVVVMALLVFMGLRWQKGSGAKTTVASPALVQSLTTVPASTYDAVGAGTMSSGPKPVSGSDPLTAGGKPRVLYVGAEYCPYCGAERWAMVTTLARFGTFSNLGETTSSHADIYPDTPTLSFHGSSYTSKYVAFTGYETQSNQIKGSTYAPLDKLSSSDEKIFATYDHSPYLPLNGNIPFIDFGGEYLSQGASYGPQLFSGLTHEQVAAQIRDPSTTLSTSVLGTANAFTAVICRLTHEQPAKVCSSSGVTAASADLAQP